MGKDKLFRALRADEIEVRIDQIGDRWCRLLLYKDARCDRRILDETFGAMNWQDSYEMIGDTLYCTVSVWDKEQQRWISKSDCGVESKTEAEKGRSSDAFKRACFVWGIGRELYTRVNLRVNNLCTKKTGTNKYGRDVFELDGDDKYQRFFVDELTIDTEKEKITHLTIINKDDEIVATYDERPVKPHKREPKEKPYREETYGLMPDGRILCLNCQAEIKDSIGKQGNLVRAMEVAKATKGLCLDCYRKAHPKKTETTEE